MRRALEAAGVKSTGVAAEAAFAKADADGDGKLTFTEFCELHALEQAVSSSAAPPLPIPLLIATRSQAVPGELDFKSLGAGIAISVSKLQWKGMKPYGVREVVVEIDVMAASESQLSTDRTILDDVDGSADFNYVSHLAVPQQSPAWTMIAHALRTPERGNSDIFFTVHDTQPDGGLVAEGFVNLESLLESGKDLADGTPIDLIGTKGTVIGSLRVGVQALSLMRAIEKRAELDGSSKPGTPRAAGANLAATILAAAGDLTWAATSRTERMRSVAIEVDIMGLCEPKPRSKPLLRRRKLHFELKAKAQVLPGTPEWDKIVRALQSADGALSEVRFTVLDTSNSHSVALGSGSLRLTDLLKREKDTLDEKLAIVDERNTHLADLVVRVSALAALQQILSAERTKIEKGQAVLVFSLQLHRLVVTREMTSRPRAIVFEADLLGATEPIGTSKPYVFREEIALDFSAHAICSPGTPGLSAIVSALEGEQRGRPLNIYVTARDASSLAPIGEATIALGELLRNGRDRERETCDLLDLSGRVIGKLRYTVLAVDALRAGKSLVKGDPLQRSTAPTARTDAGPESRQPVLSSSRALSDGERIAALSLSVAKLDELRASFRKYDDNNSGSITKLEMRRVLEAAGVKSTGEAVEAAFAKADGDGDGKISFAEYCELHSLGQAGSGLAAPP
ncbi:hypothetical protein T492DRAFT_886093, partial [Pavlovales sp. CCMP2436]